MGEGRLVAAVRYARRNPVRAHLKGEDHGLVSVRPVLSRIADFPGLLTSQDETGIAALRASEGTGKPLGNTDFIAGLERILGRRLAKRAPGRKPRSADDSQAVPCKFPMASGGIAFHVPELFMLR